MCCSVLQSIAVRCIVLQCVVEMARVVSANKGLLQHVLQCIAVYCRALYCVAVCRLNGLGLNGVCCVY